MSKPCGNFGKSVRHKGNLFESFGNFGILGRFACLHFTGDFISFTRVANQGQESFGYKGNIVYELEP